MPTISSEEAAARLNSDDNLLSFLPFGKKIDLNPEDGVKAIEPEIVLPKKKGKRRLSPYERTLIGISASSTTVKETAAQFGVSDSTVRKIIDKGEDTSVDIAVKNGIRKVNEKAVDQLLALFGVVEKKNMIEKVGSMREAMSIAKDVAAVIEKTSPKTEVTNNAQVIVMVPPERSVSEYEEMEAPLTALK